MNVDVRNYAGTRESKPHMAVCFGGVLVRSGSACPLERHIMTASFAEKFMSNHRAKTQGAIMSSQQTILKKDRRLDAGQLDDKYNPEGDGQHPLFTRQDWREAVMREDTLYGYWAWVERMLWESEA